MSQVETPAGSEQVKQQVERILAGINDGFVMFDREWRFVYVNKRAAQMFRYPKEQLIGQRIWDLFPGAMGNFFYQQLQQAVAERRELTFEFYDEPLKRWFEHRAYPIEEGLLLFSSDINERKEWEANRELLVVRQRVELGQRLLAEAGQILASTLDPQEQLANIARLAVPDLADWCAVNVFEQNWQVRHFAVAHADPAKVALAHEVQRRYPAQPEELAKRVRSWQRGQAELYLEITGAMLEASARDAEHYQIMRELHFHSAMVAPLVIGEQVLGAMTFVWAESGRRYDEQDLALAEELARRAALALEWSRLYEAERTARTETERVGERLGLLVEASSILIASTSYETALVNLVHLIVPRLADWCIVDAIGQDGLLHRLAVVHRDPTKSDLVETLKHRYPVLELQRKHTITKTLDRGQSWFDPEVSPVRLAAEARDPEHLRLLQCLGFASEMVIPLVARGQTLGTLTFVRTSDERRYKAEDLLLAEELARRAAVVVDNVRLYEAERAARAEAEASQQRLALLAEMRERNRMAQELHDTVAQALGYLNLKTAMTHAALASGHQDMALANLQELKQVISETYTDVREEIFNLRAKILSDLSFMEVLHRYIDKYRRFYHLDIQLIQEADPALFEFQPEVTSQLIRTIQEALINIRKHARVNQATIRLGQEDGAIRIIIEDQGQGFDLAKSKEKTSSFGLAMMRERVESVGGNLAVDTAPGQGTRITLHYQK